MNNNAAAAKNNDYNNDDDDPCPRPLPHPCRRKNATAHRAAAIVAPSNYPVLRFLHAEVRMSSNHVGTSFERIAMEYSAVPAIKIFSPA